MIKKESKNVTVPFSKKKYTIRQSKSPPTMTVQGNPTGEKESKE